jgi:hypothetical protein
MAAWNCPRCKRQVPERMDRCRCGQQRDAETAETRAFPWGVLGVLALMAATGWAAYSIARPPEKMAPLTMQPAQAPAPPSVIIIREQAPRETEPTYAPYAPATHAAEVVAPRPTPEIALATAPPPTLSGMEEQVQRAEPLRPKLAALARLADQLDGDYRRYFDGCYRKYSAARSTGSGTGTAQGYSSGAAVGRDWLVVFDANNVVQWQEQWVSDTAVSNETTAPCRMLWSDIVENAHEVRAGLDRLEAEARVRMVIPGVFHNLRAEYRLEWR